MKVILIAMSSGQVVETFGEIEDNLKVGDMLAKEVRFEFAKYMKSRTLSGTIDCCIMFIDPAMEHKQWRYFQGFPIPLSLKYVTNLFWASSAEHIQCNRAVYS